MCVYPSLQMSPEAPFLPTLRGLTPIPCPIPNLAWMPNFREGCWWGGAWVGPGLLGGVSRQCDMHGHHTELLPARCLESFPD